MLFPTSIFAIFFLIVFTFGWLLNSKRTAWKWFMLLASYVFYGYWNPKFVLLIMASTAGNHALACLMARTEATRARKALVSFAVVFNLGILGFFKYYSFFTINAYMFCAKIGVNCSIPLLDIVLPVGISFFTFQAMSYVIDVYRRDMEKAGSLLDFAVYLAFFPQLVAGPIVRAKTLLPQIRKPATTTSIDVGRASCLILAGLFKKIVIANYLAQQLVDPVFEDPESYAALDILFAVYGYAIQIYCDFSAYSDIAIGVALLLGLRFPINFDAPYLATSIQHFWRRWHISLSSWLRDYLYIPLGGSRGGKIFTYRNLFLTFLLGGLWHGAGWNFVIWGALHGLYLSVGRLLFPAYSKLDQRLKSWGLPVWGLNTLKMIGVFHLVCLSWVFFRAQTFADASLVLAGLARWESIEILTPWIVVVIAIGFLTQLLDGNRLQALWDRFNHAPMVWQGVGTAFVLTLILALGPKGVASFIYFQF